MFAKLHLLSQDTPEGGGGLRWRAHPYVRLAGTVPKGPAVFEWSARQRADLEALWRDPAADGARERLARDLATFSDKLGWTPDATALEDAEKHGDEYLVTLSAVPPELYVLPWEVIQVGAGGTYLSDYASAQVRYAVPGLEPREIQVAPAKPGVLFAWSDAGGAVPHDDQATAIRAAAEAGGVAFHELAQVGEASLQAALDAGPPSVLHLLCHGLPGPEGEPPRLRWGASDSPSEITATQLARMLRRHHGAIRLVVLSACGSGDGHSDPLFMTSLAQELHKKGIPSVVASRYPLSVPGSRVMTRVLYDKMLREARSLERALRATREALFRVDDGGEAHPGDAYGIQLYAYDTERFTSDNAVEAERPVLASYPFGTAARPVPASAPPPAELTLGMDADPGLAEDQLIAKLRKLSEDDSLTISIASPDGKGTLSLRVRTTTDGAQRLLGGWRSKALQVAVGVIVGELILTKGIAPAMAATSSAAAGTAGNAIKVARAVKETSQPLVSGGKALAAPGHAAASLGQAAASAGQALAPVGQAAATAGKVALTATAVVGKTLAAQLAIAVVLGTAALVGGAAVYRVYTQPACGNGTIEAGEQCDDGNTADGDGCSAGCLTEVVVAPPQPPLGRRPTVDGAPPAAGSGALAAGSGAPGTGSSAPTARGSASDVTGHGSGGAIVADDRSRKPIAEDHRPRVPIRAGPCTGCSDPANHPRCGNGTIEAGEQCDDGNTASGDGCSSTCLIEAPPPLHVPALPDPQPPDLPAPAAPQSVVVEPDVLQRLSIPGKGRVSGETQIEPSTEIKNLMITQNVTDISGTVELCVATGGSVMTARMRTKTGFDDYDQRLLAAVRDWRYRPYIRDGVAIPVCSTVEFKYSMDAD